MLLIRQRCRGRWFPAAGVVLLLAFLSSARPLSAEPASKLAAEHYRYAELLLEDLDSVPAAELGPEQYLLVIDAFQKVHRTSTASSYCDDALLQAADLYREMVDRFGPKPYRDKAIEAYQFLIHEYPSSKLLHTARQAISEIEKGVAAPKRQRQPAAHEEEEALPEVSQSNPAEDSGSRVETASPGAGAAADPAPGAGEPVDTAVARNAANDDAAGPPVAVLSSRSTAVPVSNTTKDAPHGSQLVGLQGIRFWSNPEYTRVVIELDGRVEFSYDQLRNPKRLFFDLRETRLGDRLAQEAAIEVGDSFLKRIRVAQFRRRSTRVVFDLERALYFDVAWLSNPARLVIEVRDRDEPVMLARAGAAAAASAPEAVRPAGAELAGKVETIANVKPDPTAKPPRPTFAQALDGRGATAAPADQAARTTAATEKGSEPAKSSATDPAPAIKTAKASAAGKRRAAAASGGETRAAESKPAPKPIPPAASDTASKTAVKADENPEPSGAPEAAEVELAKVTPPSDDDLPAPKAATANARGQRNLIRALGLKVGRVVIDAGHGGRDTGTIGPSGLREKDLVLDVAHRLGKLIEEGLGSEVLYTRGDDQFISLKERTKLANDAKADLFISIHANSSGSKRVRGVETYYLNFTTDSWALTVASRENAASDHSVHELQDLLSKIALKEKIEESREFATRIQSSLFEGLSEDNKELANRGVRKAPFMVLIGAKMPAVLAEIGFISNSQTEKLLKTSAYRQKVANHLYQGMLSYSESLGTISMASSAPASKLE